MGELADAESTAAESRKHAQFRRIRPGGSGAEESGGHYGSILMNGLAMVSGEVRGSRCRAKPVDLWRSRATSWTNFVFTGLPTT